LAYDDLQRRVAGAGPQCSFVQVAPPAWPVGPAESGTMELSLTSGARLTLRLPSAAPKDLVPLVQLVLRHRR
jgi:hypothetical protein